MVLTLRFNLYFYLSCEHTEPYSHMFNITCFHSSFNHKMGTEKKKEEVNFQRTAIYLARENYSLFYSHFARREPGLCYLHPKIPK